MVQSELFFCIFKLFFGAVIAFLAILLWSKTRESAWMCLVAASVTGYASIVCDLLLKLGIIKNEEAVFLGTEIPVFKYLSFFVPCFFIILAFLMMLVKSGRENKNDL